MYVQPILSALTVAAAYGLAFAAGLLTGRGHRIPLLRFPSRKRLHLSSGETLPARRATKVSGVMAVAMLACLPLMGSRIPAHHPHSGLRCHAARVDGEWYLNVTGRGTVHRVRAQGRTVRLPSPVKLGRHGFLSVDWAGAYAPDPGKCWAS